MGTGESGTQILSELALDEIVDWMRRRGVVSMSTPLGICVTLGPEPVEAKPPTPDTRTDAQKEYDRKRARLRRELGREPTAAEIEVYPV